jgi:hypothetical protein
MEKEKEGGGMNLKNLSILIAILVVLIGAVFIYNFLGKRPRGACPLKDKEFNKIELNTEKGALVFEKSGEKWGITSPIHYPVDARNFDSFLKGLKGLAIGEVISTKKEKFVSFDVQGNRKIRVIGPKLDYTFILGKMAPDYSHTYFRLPKGNKVYLSKGLSQWMVDKKLDDWRDKTILSFSKENVKEIDIKNEKIVRVDTVWMKGDKEVEKNKLNSLLSTLANLRADSFSDTIHFKPEWKVKVIFTSGEDRTIEFGKESDKKYPVRKEGDNTVFLINEWKVKRLLDL